MKKVLICISIMMKKVKESKLAEFLSDLVASITEIINDIFYYLGRTMVVWPALLNIICPYVMWYLIIYLYGIRGEFKIGGEVFVPLAFFIIGNILRNLSVRRNHANSIPIPRKRFTQEEGYGEYSVEQARINEMILYVAEVENYLERKGLLK